MKKSKAAKLARKPRIPSAREMMSEDIAYELGLMEPGGNSGVLDYQTRTKYGDGKEDE